MSDPLEAGWYMADIRTQDDRRVTLRAWFNPESPGQRKWWLGEPGRTQAIQDIIPGSQVVGWKQAS